MPENLHWKVCNEIFPTLGLWSKAWHLLHRLHGILRPDMYKMTILIFSNLSHELICWAIYIGDPVRERQWFPIAFIYSSLRINFSLLCSFMRFCMWPSVLFSVIVHNFLIHKIISMPDTFLGLSWIGWMDLIALIGSIH